MIKLYSFLIIAFIVLMCCLGASNDTTRAVLLKDCHKNAIAPLQERRIKVRYTDGIDLRIKRGYAKCQKLVEQQLVLL